MSPRPSFVERRLQVRHQRQVAGRQRRHADDVHVVLDRLARRLVGRREQRADVDVEAEVGERRGDHLLAAVVAVLAHLGDEDARAAAVVLVERLDQLQDLADVVVHAAGLRPVDARDGADLGAMAAEHLLHARRRFRRRVALARAALTARSSRLPLPRAPSVSALERGLRQPSRRARRAGAAAWRSAARARLLLSTLRMSISASSVDAELVDADDGLPAGVDARLRAGGGFLDAHLRDAGGDRLGHAAEPLDLLDVRPAPCAASS